MSFGIIMPHLAFWAPGQSARFSQVTLSTLSGEQTSFQGQKRPKSHWGSQREAKLWASAGSRVPSFLARIIPLGILPNPKERLTLVEKGKNPSSLIQRATSHLLDSSHGVIFIPGIKRLPCNLGLPAQASLSRPLQPTCEITAFDLHNHPTPIFRTAEGTSPRS